jgi:signal transduction histidine kinase
LPDQRRTQVTLTPVDASLESFASGQPSVDLRKSSPPEGTTRVTSHSQVMPKAEPSTQELELDPSVSSADRLRTAQPQELGQVVGTLAHDLNNLLQVISTTTQLLRLREQNNDSQTFLTDIALATDRAARLTCQLLDAARHERRRCESSAKSSIDGDE